MNIIVSACLMGVNCRHDGTNALREGLIKGYSNGHLTPICPEELGGLPTPRPSAEIDGGDGRDVLGGRARVIDINGKDVTDTFIKGAGEVLRIARLFKAKRAILKENSPSCGVEYIYKKGQLVNGIGVLTALLKKEGLEVKGG